MIVVRNQDTAQSVSARAGAADLKPGMVVKFAQGTARGDQPTVVKVTAADLDAVSSGTLTVGVVDYIKPDSQAVDFRSTNPVQVLDSATVVDDTIPLNAQVNVWMNKPIIAYHKTKVEAALAPTTAREADKVAFLVASGLPTMFNGAAVDTGAENYMGMVYRIDGPEVTIMFTKF